MSSAGRAMRILEAVIGAGAPPTRSDLARDLEMPTSTVAGLLSELKGLGYLHVVGGRHVPGPRLLSMSYRLSGRLRIDPATRQALERIARATGETTIFSVELGARGDAPGVLLIVDQVEGPHPLRYVAPVGTASRMYATAGGRALLAFGHRSASTIPAETLHAMTPRTLTDPAAIDEELERIRRRGYALNVEETIEGVTAIAAPVLDGGRPPIATVTIVGPSARMVEHETRLWPVLRDALEDIRSTATDHAPDEAARAVWA
jgi:DNA-binding IclR family transcriptional regulator